MSRTENGLVCHRLDASGKTNRLGPEIHHTCVPPLCNDHKHLSRWAVASSSHENPGAFTCETPKSLRADLNPRLWYRCNDRDKGNLYWDNLNVDYIFSCDPLRCCDHIEWKLFEASGPGFVAVELSGKERSELAYVSELDCGNK